MLRFITFLSANPTTVKLETVRKLEPRWTQELFGGAMKNAWISAMTIMIYVTIRSKQIAALLL